MKKIFLLIISLITGFEASAILKVCLQHRHPFTCFNQNSTELKILISTNKPEQNSYENECEERMFHKVKELELTLSRLEELKQQNPAKIEIKEDGCQTSDKQIDKTFTCNYPNQNQRKFNLSCKSRDFICKAKSTPSFQESNGTSRESSIMASERDVYSCKDINTSEKRKNHDGLILRFSDFTKFTRSAYIGQKFSYFCKYDVNPFNIFICKGEDPTTCEVVETPTIGKNLVFSMKNDNKRTWTITIKKVTASDSGTYWCGAEMNGKTRVFIHRMFLYIVTTSASPASTTTTSQPLIDGLSSVVKPLIIIGTVGLMLLLLVIVTLALYKRCFQSKNAEDKSAEQHPKEDNIYEEIPDGLQTALTSVYVTASLPINDPAPLHYSSINFRTSYVKIDAVESLIMKPSSSSCHYSAIKDSQSSTSLTSPPASSTGEPLYSTVKKPQ